VSIGVPKQCRELTDARAEIPGLLVAGAAASHSPGPLRATGIGACVGFGPLGAIVGVVVLAETATSFGLWTAFSCLAGFWLLGAVAAAARWLCGVEGRGRTLEALAHG